MPTTPTTPPTATTPVHRIEIATKASHHDPRADALLRDAAGLHIDASSATTADIYLIQADLSTDQLTRVTDKLLADPVTQAATAGSTPSGNTAQLIEVHPLPGVMDPVALSVRDAIADLLAMNPADILVSTGTRYEITGVSSDQADTIAKRLLANEVIHRVYREPFHPADLPTGSPTETRLTHIPIRDLTDAQLETLSREAHLFLSLEEMQAIRAEYQTLGREPTDIELETLAQTWSEHCVHKTLKSIVSYTPSQPSGTGVPPVNSHTPSSYTDPIDWSTIPNTANPDGSLTINNLLKSTVAAATFELMAEEPAIKDWCLSVFVDNAGIVRFDDDHAVCIKVETHNHPSAIEPYGGAATGIGGCIRDIIGTGLAAKPIASTDVFCVAPPLPPHSPTDPQGDSIPAGCLHPKRVLTQVVAGVRDYGNRMGIPTVNGAVWFDDRYIGNPLVYCGCVGVMPTDRTEGDAQPGDLIVALGGRTGRDGIHGATFSSAELTDTHADEFAHAVQIGNAIEEKRVLDAIMRARDERDTPLFSAITDCGAGGFSSAIGEMGEKIGAFVHLDKALLKYDGLTYTEIWISEAQERMVLSVPADNLNALQQICDEEHVELCVLGTFGTPGAELILNHHDLEVGRLPMHFLHEGIPTPTRKASWSPPSPPSAAEANTTPAPTDALLKLLAHPNIASKHWIIRQYDHEVKGNTIIKPLNGPRTLGPSDASVVQPVPGSDRALAIACGLQTNMGDARIGGDPYLMTLAAIDEAVRNLVCTGADPDRIAILDNFCWPSCGKPENLGSLVRAAVGCYHGAKAYKTPFVSGKDSLNNQFTTDDGTTIEIPPTLLITGMGIVQSLRLCTTSDAKSPSNVLLEVGPKDDAMGGSHYQQLFGSVANASIPRTDLEAGPAVARAVHGLIKAGLVRSAHDVSDGGTLTAIAEMLIAGHSQAAPIGATVKLDSVEAMFSESPSRYVLEVESERVEHVQQMLGGISCRVVANLSDSGQLTIDGASTFVETLTDVWSRPLQW